MDIVDGRDIKRVEGVKHRGFIQDSQVDSHCERGVGIIGNEYMTGDD